MSLLSFKMKFRKRFRERLKRNTSPLCFLLILFYLSISSAQSPLPLSALPPSEFMEMNAESVEKKWGAGWKGILFICDPYCRMISVREDKDWNPPIPNIKVKENQLRGVAKTDPLYPLLIAQFGGSSPSELADVTTLPPKANNDEETIPPYAKPVFEFGYAFSFGSATSSYLTISDTQIQSELKSPLATSTAPLRFIFMKGKPIRFFNMFWQFQFQYLMENASAAALASPGLTITPSQNSMELLGLLMRDGYRVVVGLSQLNQKMTANSNSLTLYSYQTTRTVLNLGVLWKRFLLAYDYSLSANVTEEQNFRTSPIQDSWNAFRLSYYSKNFSAFDFEYGLYGLAESTTGQQESNVNAAIFSTQSSSFKASSTRFEFGIRFGEDLFQ